MGLPRVLTVNRDGELEINPAVEVEKLRRAEEVSILQAGAPIKQSLTTLRRELRIALGTSKPKIAVRLLTSGKSVWELVVDVPARLVSCGEVTFALPPQLELDDALRIFIDGSVIESFIAGREALTCRVYNVRPGQSEFEIALLKGESVAVKQWPLEAISTDRLTT
ncbi:MAG: GH32 C-terminal domain-containing protein [Terracidiphilus sp.]